MSQKPPIPLRPAMIALAGCAWRTVLLLAQHRIHQPSDHVGQRMRFADGTGSTVYRETVVDRPPTEHPAVLVVGFRLRAVRRSWQHAAFRCESVLNTLLFAGFRGFVSKLWLANDEHGIYRGVYEWDDPALAETYVRALWWPLALVSVPSSIQHVVLPGLSRDEVLRDPSVIDSVEPDGSSSWWRITEAALAR